MEFNFDSLDPTQFEEFCYELLSSLSPAQLKWRKGTPLASSPSDQGRDLEATFLKTEIDGSKIAEKWHVECKHYHKGVPPEKLAGALTWAMGARPDVLLIIASGYLSNSCTNFLSTFIEQNKPAFRIIVWDRKKLEDMTSGNSALRAKFGLTTDIPYLKYINNYHAEYSLKSKYNTIEFFLSAMDTLSPELRMEVFYMTFFEQIKPRFRRPRHDQESLSDCMIDIVDYEAYKVSVQADKYLPRTYVSNVVTNALGCYFVSSDTTSIKKVESNIDDMIENLGEHECKEHKEFLLELKNNHASKTKKRYENYNIFCNSFIKTLLSETPSLKEISSFKDELSGFWS